MTRVEMQVGRSLGRRWPPDLHRRRDRHQPQRRPGDGQAADRRRRAWPACDAVKFQKRTPELCVPPDQQRHDARDPLGLHHLPRVPPQGRVRTSRPIGDIDAYCREQAVDWFVSVLGRALGRLHASSSNRPAIKIPSASLTDHDPAATAARDTGRPVDPLHRHVDHGADRRAVAAAGDRRSLLIDPRHQHLSLRTGGAEPAHDRRPCASKFDLPDRLFRPRGRPDPFDRGGGRPGRVHGRAPHHARPRHVGQRPGGLGRAGGLRSGWSSTSG